MCSPLAPAPPPSRDTKGASNAILQGENTRVSMGSPPGISHEQHIVSPAVLRVIQCIILRRRSCFSCPPLSPALYRPNTSWRLNKGPVSRSDMRTPSSVSEGSNHPGKTPTNSNTGTGIQTETLGGEAGDQRRARSRCFSRAVPPLRPCPSRV